MNLTGIVVAIFVAIGGLFFWLIDREQMKKHVPYGECDSIFSLSVIRNIALFTCIFFWPVMIGRELLGMNDDDDSGEVK